MKKFFIITTLVLSTFASAYSRCYVYCIQGHAYFIFTDGEAHIVDTWYNGTCHPDGFMWVAGVAIHDPNSTETSFSEATTSQYSDINNLNMSNNVQGNNSDLQGIDLSTASIVYADPFKITNTSFAVMMANSDGYALYGIRINGNPVSNGNLSFDLLSTASRTVSISVVGNNNEFSYSTTQSVAKGSNTINLSVTGYRACTATVAVSCSDGNTLRKQVIFQ